AEIEAFLLLHVLVGEAVEAAARELLAQRLVDPFAMAERAGAEEFDHQQIAIAVDHQAADPVALAVDHAPGIGDAVELQHLAAQGHGIGDLAREPAGIDRYVGMGFEDAHRDPRMPVVEAATDPVALDADHVDDAAGLGPLRRLFDQALEDPRVAGTPGVLQAYGRVVCIHARHFSRPLAPPARPAHNRPRR